MLRPGADRQGDRICRRGCRRHAAAVGGAEGAPRRREDDDGLRDAGAAAGSGAGAHGAPRHLGRPADSVAPVRRIRADRGAAGNGNPRARRRAAQSRQPQAARRHPVRQDGPAGRHEDQDRRVVDLRAGARRACRSGPRTAAQDPRLAPGRETEIDLYRRAAGLRESEHASRAYQLRAGRDHDGTAVVVRAEFAEHPGAQRGRPQDPQGLRRRARQQAGLAPTIRRSNCG